MKTTVAAALASAALALAGCAASALLAFPAPEVTAPDGAAVELPYREGPGGLVLVRGRVNGRADVDFVLDTGAPVTVLLEGPRTAAIGLDTTGARPLGDPANPATPTGVIAKGFEIAFGPVTYRGLSAVVIPERTLPCREAFDAAGFGGVIGADLFRRFVVEIDPAARVVRLHPPAAWRPPPRAAIVPIVFEGRHPFVEATISPAPGQPVYTTARNAVDGSRAGTVGITLFRDRRLVVDYPGRRIVLD